MTTVKYGYWTVEVDEEITTPWLKNRYVCSQCGSWQTYGRTLFCPNCGAKMTMTNGDRIRAKTDEELAEWCAQEADCPHSSARNMCAAYGDVCYRCLLDWLKQEVKDE